MKWMIWPTVFLLTAQVALGAGAKPKEHQKAEQLKRELNLSDDQLAKITAIRKGKKDDMKATKEQFKATRKAFKEAMDNPASTKEDLTAKFEAFQKQRDEFQRRRFATMLEMRSILNPEQMKKFREMKRQQWGKHKGKGHWD